MPTILLIIIIYLSVKYEKFRIDYLADWILSTLFFVSIDKTTQHSKQAQNQIGSRQILRAYFGDFLDMQWGHSI